MKQECIETVGCAGCFRKIQVGVVPKGLNFPSGAGVNVWCKVSESTSLLNASGTEVPMNPNKQEINLCHECFNGHISGKKHLSLDMLGVSVVAVPHSEEIKFVKIEGPTKFVTLGEVAEKPDARLETGYVRTRGGGRRRKIRRQSSHLHVSPNAPTAKSDTANSKKQAETEILIQNADMLEQPGLLNFLAIGTGSLGSVEMTDDDGTAGCDVTVKTEQVLSGNASEQPSDSMDYVEPCAVYDSPGFAESLVKMEMEEGSDTLSVDSSS